MVYLHQGRRLAAVFCVCQLLFSVHPLPVQAEEIAAPGSIGEKAAPFEGAAGKEGVASYYARQYNGRTTNSGARYDPKKLTAASADLPLGTRVRVVNLANGQEVVVTVNDRCRRKKVPFIDLSRAAARKLGFLGKGTARVRIIPLDDESDGA